MPTTRGRSPTVSDARAALRRLLDERPRFHGPAAERSFGLRAEEMPHHSDVPRRDLPDLACDDELSHPLDGEHTVDILVCRAVIVVVVRDPDIVDIHVT